jgi:outer membrane protein assembly factor BamB
MANSKPNQNQRMENKLKESPLELLWTKEIEGGISKLAFADGNIVVGTKNGWIKCFDLDGKLKWKYEIDSEPKSIGLSKDYIVITSEKWKLYLFDINGNLKWQRNDCGYSLISNNHILAGLKLFDIEGNLKWKKEILHVTKLDISNNYVAFATEGGYETVTESFIYLFNIYGQLKWRRTPYNDIGSDILIVKIIGNNIIVVTDDFLHIFDLEGNLKSKYGADAFGFGVWIDIANKGTVLGSGDVVCLLDENCNLKWQKMIGVEPECFPDLSGRYPVICEDYVFVGTYSGSLYVFDLDGNEIYKEKSKDECGDPLCLFKWDRYLLCTGYHDKIIYLLKINP